ncbi:glycoside hydrolase family 43 protein [Gilvimarinus chinensis]|uniref:glycoside hydrolase family 43 protein n=1 Tax=Gilvimarinus chinensis TaxID=396005 RepID=UPI00035FAB19|nr:glycoside hydrolase family 43 protein [Gilvimarinus chinensis]
MADEQYADIDYDELNKKALSQPLVTHMYTADPSAHVFDGKIYIYPSHDVEGGVAFNDNGDHFCMEDYHVFSMESPESEVVDHGVALHVDDVPWAARQMWAPDATRKNGKYYLYFPAKRADDIFQIGVAVGDSPVGPFTPEPEPIADSYSIDPAVFADDDGEYYLYIGGIWGGQLQKYRNNEYSEANEEPADHEPALGPIVAKLSDDMKSFAEAPREIKILDESGEPLKAGDHERRYFEGPWVHRYQGKYYLSYSTGNTHYLCYGIGDNPYGPFTYQGKILNPVVGWTTHHSICQYEDRWFLFYHDSSLSKGVTHLRSIKMAELHYDDEGRIIPIEPYPG